MHSRCFARRHNFSVGGSYCIQEQTHFELLGSRKSCTTACFVWGAKRYAHTSSPVTVDSSHSFPSVRHLATQSAHTLRYPSFSWTVFASVLINTSTARDGSRIANRQFSKISSSIHATSTPAIDVLGQPHVLSTIFERSVPLSNTRHFHCAITLHHHQENKFRP